MSPLLAMLFLSLVVSCASQSIVLTLVKNDQVVDKCARYLIMAKHVPAWVHMHRSEVFKIEGEKAIGKDTIIHIVARTIKHPTSNIITLDDGIITPDGKRLGCNGKCLAEIIEKIVKPAEMIYRIIFWTSSIDVNYDYSKESTNQDREDSLIVAFLSALKGFGIKTIVTATVGHTDDSPKIIFAKNNKNGFIFKEVVQEFSGAAPMHKFLLEYTTGEYRHTKYFIYFLF